MIDTCKVYTKKYIKIQYVYFNFRNIFSPLRTKSPPPDMVINVTRLLMVLYLQTTTLGVISLALKSKKEDC